MSAEECLKHPWLATVRLVQKRPLSTEKLKRFIIRRKWQVSALSVRPLSAEKKAINFKKIVLNVMKYDRWNT